MTLPVVLGAAIVAVIVAVVVILSMRKRAPDARPSAPDAADGSSWEDAARPAPDADGFSASFGEEFSAPTVDAEDPARAEASVSAEAAAAADAAPSAPHLAPEVDIFAPVERPVAEDPTEVLPSEPPPSVASIAWGPAAVVPDHVAPAPDDDAVDASALEKLRVPDAGLTAYVHAEFVDGAELLVFTTRGFAEHDRPELALLVGRADVADSAVVPALKRFTGLALTLLDRDAPLRAGEILAMPGTFGTVSVGGFVIVETTARAGHVMVGISRGRDLAQVAEGRAGDAVVSPIG